MPRAALVLLVLVALLLSGCRDERCRLPEIRCGDRCVDASSDPANCGACGVTVGPGQTCCAAPVDLLSDAFHCGACGHRCPVNGSCNAGACECPAGWTACGSNPGACVNLQTGEGGGYCGTCFRTCQGTGVAGSDASCVAGDCVCAGPPAATDCRTTSPAMVCLNTLVDPLNCGDCGVRCFPHGTCASNGAPTPSGVCGCGASDWPDFCDTTVGCVNRATDPQHCGACGNACTGGTPTCSSGKCCPLGETNCSGACVNLQTSTADCNACGNACAPGKVCSGGTCVCGGATPITCGGSCCPGIACCDGGTTCQKAHPTGLGESFHDCLTYPTDSSLTRAAAVLAASAWGATAASDATYCDPYCLAGQKLGACAVWCYGISPRAGRVRAIAGSCDPSACPNDLTSYSRWGR